MRLPCYFRRWGKVQVAPCFCFSLICSAHHICLHSSRIYSQIILFVSDYLCSFAVLPSLSQHHTFSPSLRVLFQCGHSNRSHLFLGLPFQSHFLSPPSGTFWLERRAAAFSVSLLLQAVFQIGPFHLQTRRRRGISLVLWMKSTAWPFWLYPEHNQTDKQEEGEKLGRQTRLRSRSRWMSSLPLSPHRWLTGKIFVGLPTLNCIFLWNRKGRVHLTSCCSFQKRTLPCGCAERKTSTGPSLTVNHKPNTHSVWCHHRHFSMEYCSQSASWTFNSSDFETKSAWWGTSDQGLSTWCCCWGRWIF